MLVTFKGSSLLTLPVVGFHQSDSLPRRIPGLTPTFGALSHVPLYLKCDGRSDVARTSSTPTKDAMPLSSLAAIFDPSQPIVLNGRGDGTGAAVGILCFVIRMHGSYCSGPHIARYLRGRDSEDAS